MTTAADVSARFQRLAGAGRYVVLTSLVAATWLFGGVEGQTQVWLCAAFVLALSLSLPGLLRGRGVGAAILPLGLGLGLAALQLLPLGPQTLQGVSPQAAELAGLTEQRVAEGAQGSTDPAGATHSISLYPASTRHDLALLVLGVAGFLAGAWMFSAGPGPLWLAATVAMNGAALSLFGIVQQLSWNGQLFWSVPLSKGGSPFASYVNRNNAAGLLNMCLAGAIAMTLASLNRQTPVGLKALDLRARLLGGVGSLSARSAGWLGVTACLIAGVVASMSRGGWLALLAASTITAAILFAGKRMRGAGWLATAALIGFALIAWAGMAAAVSGRFETLFADEAAQARTPNWQDGLAAAADFLPAGSGLGTYRYVYRPYQNRLDEQWYFHAENQYLETLDELGWPGVLLLLAAIGLVFAQIARLLRGADDMGYLLGVAACFALITQVVQGGFDFGLYVPANMLLLALWCGAASGRAAALPAGGPLDSSSRVMRSRAACSLSWCAGCVVLLAWAGAELHRGAAVDRALSKVSGLAIAADTKPESLRDAIALLSPAVDGQSDNAEGHRELARLWTGLYRAEALPRLLAERSLGDDQAQLWLYTSPVNLHAQAHYLQRASGSRQLVELRAQPVVRENLGQAFVHLQQAVQACPIDALSHELLAELNPVCGSADDELDHLRRAVRLAPANYHIQFHCGTLAMHQNEVALACECWRRSLSLSPLYFEDILRQAGSLPVHRILDDVLPASPDFLIRVARERFANPDHAATRRLLAARAESLIDSDHLPADQTAYLRASAAALQERPAEAISHYQQAIALRPDQTRWRFELAIQLAAIKDWEQAHDQARWCVRVEPANLEYRGLLDQINLAR